ncbi:MAG: zf-TFIIB domain-containing protein [bacterium]|nr:zf-TFIIB domain-containing protein [bacterium]
MGEDSTYSKQTERKIDAWFSENEERLIEEIKEKAKKKKEEEMQKKLDEEKTKLKDLHWMKCPKCGHDMSAVYIEEIEIDKCGNCEGIYFDKGEFHNILLKKEDSKKSFFRKMVFSK